MAKEQSKFGRLAYRICSVCQSAGMTVESTDERFGEDTPKVRERLTELEYLRTTPEGGLRSTDKANRLMATLESSSFPMELLKKKKASKPPKSQDEDSKKGSSDSA